MQHAKAIWYLNVCVVNVNHDSDKCDFCLNLFMRQVSFEKLI